jgi:hypothetical protein
MCQPNSIGFSSETKINHRQIDLIDNQGDYMKFVVFVALFLCFGISNSQAHEEGVGHTPNYCSVENKNVCAHLKFLNVLNTKDEGKLIAHILTPSNEPIQNFKLDLWMNMGGHGHGSSPVDIAPLAEANHFSVANAWFVMKGTWLVRIDFDSASEHYHIEIPVSITQ